MIAQQFPVVTYEGDNRIVEQISFLKGFEDTPDLRVNMCNEGVIVRHHSAKFRVSYLRTNAELPSRLKVGLAFQWISQ